MNADLKNMELAGSEKRAFRTRIIKRWLRRDDRVQIVFRGKKVVGCVIAVLGNEVLLELRLGEYQAVRRFPCAKIERFVPQNLAQA